MNCRDEEGFIIRNAEGIEVWKDCECLVERQAERLIKSSKITPEFARKSFDNFKLENRPQIVRDAHYAAKHYFNNFAEIRNDRKNSMALLGVPGVGKTHLLMAISNALIKKGTSCSYFPWVETFNDLKDDFDLLEQKVNYMQKVDVLYIDDLFKGRKTPTEFQLEQLFAIINYRYLNNKPILISSEKDIEEICEIDMGLGSRIYEMCKDYTVLLTGDLSLNYRLAE
ncbi:ATP-binding protein [Chengkuizengella sp. SCS-71B]|uniref:ATP-binding protein n=1 Tax=Chengkuizengella sp. SCS-71B TaxID=3115290 RepID=UPI0032C21A1F